MFRRATLGVLFVAVVGCTKEPASKPEAKPAAAPVILTAGPSSAGLSPEAQAGHRLYAVCHSCHDAEKWPPLGPPMFGVQRRYKRATEGKAAFVERMVTFIETPKAETAVMEHPVERFGLMPALPLGKAPLSQIAAYVFEAKFPPPCTHWTHAMAEGAKAEKVDEDHMRKDHKMFDKFCK